MAALRRAEEEEEMERQFLIKNREKTKESRAARAERFAARERIPSPEPQPRAPKKRRASKFDEDDFSDMLAPPVRNTSKRRGAATSAAPFSVGDIVEVTDNDGLEPTVPEVSILLLNSSLCLDLRDGKWCAFDTSGVRFTGHRAKAGKEKHWFRI